MSDDNHALHQSDANSVVPRRPSSMFHLVRERFGATLPFFGFVLQGFFPNVYYVVAGPWHQGQT